MASNDYAHQLSKDKSYNIDELITAWESGWEHLERYAKLQFPYEPKKYTDKSIHYLDRLVFLIIDILFPSFNLGRAFDVPHTNISCIELLKLAASDKDTPYTPLIGPVEHPGISIKERVLSYEREGWGEWSRDRINEKKAIQKFTTAFIKSTTIREVLENIADKKNVAIFINRWTEPGRPIEIIADGRFDKKCLNEKISSKITEVMGWLKSGTKNKNAFENAWWNCLWLYMKPSIDLMLEIKINIQNGTPINKQKIDVLNTYISYGCPAIQINETEEGYKPRIILSPQEYALRKFRSPIPMLSTLLLIQPAFDLSQKFQQSFPKPRLVTQCHAPSCGKFFYTHDKRQVVCGSTAKNKTSDCRNEWIQYMRWLNCLTDVTSEKDWNNPKLIDLFLQR